MKGNATMKIKKYSAYKDSGIEWIGDIPEHWEVRKMKYVYTGFSNGTSAYQVPQGKTLYPVSRIETISLGEINYKKVGFIRKRDALLKYKLEKGDILISNINSFERVGNTALYRGEKELYHGMNLLRISPRRGINSDYYYYSLKTDIFLHPIKLNCKPAINQVSVPSSKVKNVFFPLPPLSEQKKIASFLDKKTAEVDKAIELKQKENELLKEHRQITINQAVTRGLNPNVPLKDSGIEWIGDIPEHWEVRKFRYLFSYCKGKNAQNEYDYLGSDFLPYVNMEYIRGGKASVYIDFNKENVVVVNKDDLILLWDGSNAGEFHLSRQGVLASTLSKINILVSNEILDESFIFFLVKLVEKEIKQNTIGMGIPHVNGDYLKNIKLPLPPLFEQKKIASFLDKKTAEIDKAIELKQKENELLKEHRQITINQAVTRGLNPNVPLKDSGIEWIGDIPEHWEVRKLKYLSTFKNGYAFNSNYYSYVGIPIMRIGDIKEDFNLNTCPKYPNEKSKYLDEYIISKGSVLLALTGATIGKSIIYNKADKAYLNQRVGMIESITDFTTSIYLYYIFQTSFFRDYITIMCDGGAQENIGKSGVGNYKCILPPLSEQKEIAAYLEEVDKETNRLIELNHRAIEKLKEYKQVLIDQAVRGKICLV